MIATRTTSPGQVRSPMRAPTVGLLEGSVISTRFVAPSWNVSSLTRSPTVTASSTSADISRGVETETSTPQSSLNSHSFFGWFTRATVRDLFEASGYAVRSVDTVSLPLSPENAAKLARLSDYPGASPDLAVAEFVVVARPEP